MMTFYRFGAVVLLLALYGCATSDQMKQDKQEANLNVLQDLHRAAQIAYAQGELDRAADIYQKIIAQSEVDAESWFVIGNIYAGKGDHDKAIFSYRKSLSLNGFDARVWNNLSVVLLKDAWNAAQTARRGSYPEEPAQLSSKKIIDALSGLSFLSTGQTASASASASASATVPTRPAGESSKPATQLQPKPQPDRVDTSAAVVVAPNAPLPGLDSPPVVPPNGRPALTLRANPANPSNANTNPMAAQAVDSDRGQIFADELSKAKAALALAATPEAKTRAQSDLQGIQREITRLPKPVAQIANQSLATPSSGATPVGVAPDLDLLAKKVADFSARNNLQVKIIRGLDPGADSLFVRATERLTLVVRDIASGKIEDYVTLLKGATTSLPLQSGRMYMVKSAALPGLQYQGRGIEDIFKLNVWLRFVPASNS